MAAPVGWPDITDELAEVRFLLLQGFEEEAATMLATLRARFVGHPDLQVVDAAPPPPAPINPAEKRRRDQAVTVRTEPVAAAAAAAAADASRSAGRGAAARAAAPSAQSGSTVVSPRPAAVVAESERPKPVVPAVGRNAGRLPPRGLTIRSEAVPARDASPAAAAPAPVAAPAAATAAAATAAPDATAAPAAAAVSASEPAVDVTATAASVADPVVAVPPAAALRAVGRPVETRAGSPSSSARLVDPASLIAVSPLDRPSPSPADSASETLEFDVDAEFADEQDYPAALSTAQGVGFPPASSTMNFEDSGETFVDLEFERLDRTVVSRAPPAPPVFDDEPTTGSGASLTPEPAQSPPVETSQGTVIARAPSRPAPWTPESAGRDAGRQSGGPGSGESRRTVIPAQTDRPSVPAPFEGVPPPGSTLVPGTTPPAGGFGDDDEEHDEASTIAMPAVTDAVMASLQAVPSPSSPRRAPAVTGLTAPQSAVAAAEVVAVAPPRSPGRGRARKDGRQTGGVRIVMLGARGEPVAERTIEAGGFLDLGSMGSEPWSDDAFIEPTHARFSVADGGVRVDELVPMGAVFLRIQGSRPLREDDQVRVGQSLLSYRRPQHGDPTSGPWGSVVMQVAPDGATHVIPLGNAGVTVGREFGEITLPGDTFVSSTHCRVITAADGIHIEDLDSSNGTYVRMRSGERMEIGQCVLIGQTQFVVRKR